jgi:glutamine amidotransferase
MPKVSVVNYGVGNLHSITKGLARAGARPVVVREPDDILSARCLVFPGVGAFGPAASGLRSVRARLASRLLDGVPALGVCLGMQMLCESSDEGAGLGLGLVPGRVRRLRARRLPNIGWSRVRKCDSDPLLDGVPDRSYVYFVHSYVLPQRPGPGARVLATAEHGETFPAAVRVANTVGVQFHPEKSSQVGASLLKNFVEFAGRAC